MGFPRLKDYRPSEALRALRAGSHLASLFGTIDVTPTAVRLTHFD
jgi:hypothetical protein